MKFTGIIKTATPKKMSNYKFRILSLILIVVFIFFINKATACTAFCLENQNKIVVAKNLDWPVDLGYILTNKPGINKTAFNSKKLNWVSKYGSVTFNQFGKEFPLGGMNEKGLVIEELNMPYVKPINDSTKFQLNEFQIIQFILDNCKSTECVVKQLNKIQLNVVLQTLHYLVIDSSGNTLIIEFNGKNFDYHYPDKTGYPILSNNKYAESLRYLKNFTGFGGEFPVLNRQGSNERFVSVANMLLHYKNENPVEYAFDILDTVKQDDTQWSIVYDVTNLKVYVKFHNCSKRKTIDFEKVKFTQYKICHCININDCSDIDENYFSTFTKETNTNHIKKVFCTLSEYIEISEKKYLFDKMAKYGNQYLPK